MINEAELKWCHKFGKGYKNAKKAQSGNNFETSTLAVRVEVRIKIKWKEDYYASLFYVRQLVATAFVNFDYCTGLSTKNDYI